MKKNFSRNLHFLGSKIRSLRKSNGLTLEDLSIRCIQIDPNIAPSISYLSLIETSRRLPSKKLLDMLAGIFQKEVDWFFDESITSENKNTDSTFENMNLEPNFLFSKNILEKTIPALLTQTGVTGRQFAQILIRAYQEKSKNQFPNIERMADEVGLKKFPLTLDDLYKLYSKNNLKIQWFDQNTFSTETDSGMGIKTLFRSFFSSPNKVYINEKLKNEPARLKYDLATLLGHKILHGGDGLLSSHATGGQLGGSPRPFEDKSGNLEHKDVLYAWRDFECSFFAGALLCPKIPFRRYLASSSYDIHTSKHLELTPAVVMRRMTAVSNYRHWHYFDAYPPGYLRAVYRGNGIPLPWGNMRMVTDPCNQWGVFKLLNESKFNKPLSQISIMKNSGINKIYSSLSIKTKDASGNPHVICVGIDLEPAFNANNLNFEDIMEELNDNSSKGDFLLKGKLKNDFEKVAKVLNINWVKEAVEQEINIICPRSTNCPREKMCTGTKKMKKKVSWLNQIKKDIISKNN